MCMKINTIVIGIGSIGIVTPLPEDLFGRIVKSG